jgi:hypothetical protein
MATTRVPTIAQGNISISSIKVATSCNETTNLSLSSLCNGGNFGGIDHTFSAAGGPAFQFDVGLGEYLGLEDPPFEMSETADGGYS